MGRCTLGTPSALRGGVAIGCLLIALAALVVPRGTGAQDIEAAVVAPTARAAAPPITPGRAFLMSALVPGLAQARLDRPTGVLFVTMEAVALSMYVKTSKELAVARSFRRDSVPLTYVIDQATGRPERDPESGEPQVATWAPPRFDAGRVRSRKTHVEDWIALLAFNHLMAGADAFVAAQLWDLPTQVQLRTWPGNATLTVRVRW